MSLGFTSPLSPRIIFCCFTSLLFIPPNKGTIICTSVPCLSAVMYLAFVPLTPCACTDALLLPPGPHGRIASTLPGSISSASSPQVWPTVSLKLVLYFTLNAAGSQNYAHCSLLFLALCFPHLPTKICSPSENGLYFLTMRKHLSHGGCGAVGCHTPEPSSQGRVCTLPLPDPSLQPRSRGKWLICLVAAGFVAPPVTVCCIYGLLYASVAKFTGVVAGNYWCVRISLL